MNKDRMNAPPASTPHPNRRRLLALAAAAVSAAASQGTWAQGASTWPATLSKARGQRVYLNAWGGSERTNAYLQWAGTEVEKRFGVAVEHVKLTDTAEAVKRVRGEKAAGKLKSVRVL